MSDLTLVSKVTFSNHAGSLSPPFTQSGIGYLIPAPKHFMKIDYSKFLATPKTLEIDIKNFQPHMEKIREAGVDLVQTKYFLKKDSYAIMLSKDSKSMVFCNVNERVLL